MSNTIETLTNEESVKLLEQLLSEDGTFRQRLRGHRNHCMALLMLEAGLRVGEVVALNRDDLILNGVPSHSLVVRREIAKGGHERIVPLRKTITDDIRLMDLNIWYEVNFLSEMPAFTTLKNRKRLTVRQVQRIIESAAMSALGRKIHPHILRHTFATNLMRKTSIRVVQELLGHKRIATTQVYTHPNSVDLREAVESL